MNDVYETTQDNLLFFSGNLSFINDSENGISTLEEFEKLFKRKIKIKILCRITFASLTNLSKLDFLLKKYPDLFEIRHCYQPLRGLLSDGIHARFREEENSGDFKDGELRKDLQIFYRFNELVWVKWLESCFWKLWRRSIDHTLRMKQLKEYF